jgi:hypothetical protein
MIDILIATSIAPRNLEPQIAAVETWRELGMDVLAVNSDEEVALIKPNFPDIDFYSTGPSVQVAGGRNLVTFDDILSGLRQVEADTFGIINSDIILDTTAKFPEFISQHAKETLTFGSRIDVETAASREGKSFELGYDFFFFNRQILDSYPASSFHFGAPWWDLWAAFWPLMNGKEIKKIITPAAYHVKHETVWGDEWDHYGNYFAELTASFAENEIEANSSWAKFSSFILRQAFMRNSILSGKDDEAARHFNIFFLNMLGSFIPRFINDAATDIEIT